LYEVLKSGELNVDGVRIRVVKRDGGEVVVVAEGFIRYGDEEEYITQTYMLRIW
jgi:hypothetical protein